MPTIILTIQQLNDRLWAEPIDRISNEFGLSDRGLGKLCARHTIPVPERGRFDSRQFPFPSCDVRRIIVHT
jgi:hypothetical protein